RGSAARGGTARRPRTALGRPRARRGSDRRRRAGAREGRSRAGARGATVLGPQNGEFGRDGGAGGGAGGAPTPALTGVAERWRSTRSRFERSSGRSSQT